MENRIAAQYEESAKSRRRSTDAHPIAEVLAELLAQYQIRFPVLRIAVVETPAGVM